MNNESLLEKFKNLDFIKMDRRTFIKAVGAMGASLFLQIYKSDIAKAFNGLPETKVLWLHGVMDSGCSISMLDGENPDILEFLQLFNLNLLYHEVLMMQQGIFVDGQLANTSDLKSCWKKFWKTKEAMCLLQKVQSQTGLMVPGNTWFSEERSTGMFSKELRETPQ